MNATDRARYTDGDDCRMCDDGSWTRDAVTCPACDAELPEEDDEA